MNYYKVEAKCGHVGRNNYIIKTFYVISESKKEAAKKVRHIPRVKHHHKDAIISVQKIEHSEYLKGKEKNNNDLFFKVHNSTESRRLCAVKDEEVKKEPEASKYYKVSHARSRLAFIANIKEWNRERNYVYE